MFAILSIFFPKHSFSDPTQYNCLVQTMQHILSHILLSMPTRICLGLCYMRFHLSCAPVGHKINVADGWNALHWTSHYKTTFCWENLDPSVHVNITSTIFPYENVQQILSDWTSAGCVEKAFYAEERKKKTPNWTCCHCLVGRHCQRTFEGLPQH